MTQTGKASKKALELFASGAIDHMEVGTVRGLRKIHAYISDGIYDFAGQLRHVNIAKGNFRFANCLYLPEMLAVIEKTARDRI